MRSKSGSSEPTYTFLEYFRHYIDVNTWDDWDTSWAYGNEPLTGSKTTAWTFKCSKLQLEYLIIQYSRPVTHKYMHEWAVHTLVLEKTCNGKIVEAWRSIRGSEFAAMINDDIEAQKIAMAWPATFAPVVVEATALEQWRARFVVIG